MKTTKNQWVRAEKMPNYTELHNAVARVAGEGQQVTAEQVGKTPRDFQEDVLLVVVLRNTEILYSFNPDTGEFCVECLGLFLTPRKLDVGAHVVFTTVDGATAEGTIVKRYEAGRTGSVSYLVRDSQSSRDRACEASNIISATV